MKPMRYLIEASSIELIKSVDGGPGVSADIARRVIIRKIRDQSRLLNTATDLSCPNSAAHHRDRHRRWNRLLKQLAEPQEV
jgi:hypothetical protein